MQVSQLYDEVILPHQGVAGVVGGGDGRTLEMGSFTTGKLKILPVFVF